ncbi:MAG: PAS domain S-box protein [Myxococcales bacterium]|nr:MAG: PAS domain S-box protein [Myxococcales bacterium]
MLDFSILDSLDEGVAVIDARFRVTFWNPSAERLYGFSVAEALQKPLYDLISLGAGESIDETLREAFNRPGEWRREVTHESSATGRAVWVDWTLRPFTAQTGEPAGLISISRDITGERNRRMVAPGERDIFKRAIDEIRALFLVVGPDRRIKHASPAFLEIIGGAFEDIQTKDLSSLLLPVEALATIDALAERLKKAPDSGPYKTEFDLETPDGERRRFKASAWAAPGVRGELKEMVVVATEIVVAKTIETDESRLLLINQAILDMVTLPASRDLYQYIAAKLAEVTDSVFVSASEYDEINRRLICRAFAGVGNVTRRALEIFGQHPVGVSFEPADDALAEIGEGKMIRLPGGLYDVMFRKVPRSVCVVLETILGIGDIYGIGFTWKGKVLGDAVVAFRRGAIVDVALVETMVQQASTVLQRMAAEEALKRSEERYRNLLNSSRDMVYTLDDLGNVTFISAQVTAYGFKPEDAIGRNFLEFIAPEDRERIMAEFEKASREKTSFPSEFRMMDSTGKICWLEDLGVPILDPSGQPTGQIGILRDITERKRAEREKARLEEQLQQAMKMEAVGRLAGGIAHDFNNLLTGITGNIAVAQMDLAPNSPLAGVLSEANKAAESAMALTRQLLAFSRKQIIEPKVVNLSELISSLHKMLARLIGEDIELQTIPGGNLGSAKIDPGQFEQILVNLAVNARDAMPEGGKLVIETANAELDEAYCRKHSQLRPGGFVMLAVSDTGLGMSEEVKQHLFEPFFTTKPPGQGTGLGLATIYGAVQQANGAIEVHSDPGKGTTFKLYLPRVAEKAERLKREEPARVPQANDMPGGNETVLLVEDEAVVRELGILILKRLGYKVLHAENGGEAIMLVEEFKNPIDLLITDVVMPGMNGRDLAERLTHMKPEMKVLYASGYTADVIAQHGVLEAGLNFIGKPYTPQGLAKKIRNTLG